MFKRFSSAQKAQRAVLVLLLVLLIPAQPGFAGPPLERLTNSNLSADPENTRYGLLGVLDSRSQYGLGVLPEPFLVDDSDVQKFIPMFELKGETRVNKRDTGRTNLLGDAGFRANLKAIGPVQPRLGFSFIFPLNDLARSDQHWGTITSLVFDF